ncbi:ABC transporter substrate-binding protein [Streptomyces sp. NPDC058357]|uniref:ABC transporter substrate-binding protein n=1 Tax=unclassified Streptomyces TaxID=2593676 RepID=UPI003652AD7E
MSRQSVWFAVAATVSVLALAGCTSAATGPKPGGTLDADAPVTITVDAMPTSDQKEQLAAFDERVKAFHSQYPNITVKGSETRWNTQTFAAQLAGDTLPTTISVPCTEIGNIIRNGQAADLTDYLTDETLPSSTLNDDQLKIAQNSDKRTFGVPTDAYGMVVFYNRDLYRQAGLDPDKPPATWEEVRANAKAITEATKVAGFQVATTNNHGGWMLSSMSYGFGSTVESVKGDSVKATVDNAATAEALRFLKDLRWKDNTFAKNFLLTNEEVGKAFAAGNTGQMIGMGSDYQFNQFVRVNKMDANKIGMGLLPQTSDGLGTLGGGAVQIVSPKASPNEIAAALKWTKYLNFAKFTDEKAAVAQARAADAGGAVVGAPTSQLVSDKVHQQYLGWIKDHINIDRGHFEVFLKNRRTQPVIPEPPVAAQQVYATLDPVLQSVLSDRNADIPALLKDAQAQAESFIAGAG